MKSPIMKSPIAFLAPILGGLLGCMVLSATIYAAEEADRQLPPEAFLSQDQQQGGISPSQMTQQESITSDSTGDSMPQEDSSPQIEAKKLEGELRKLLLLACPR